ncbi:hypothetical protein [Sphingomonas sp. T9W2]|uniref:hypothetical protein n=1 Tax=Sphingomonas sp. T9W2 TaxID=3143183 RepID=UPI0031F5C89A
MSLAGIVFLSIAAGLVAFVFITTDWGRVISILRSGPAGTAPEPDRWRRVHLDGDRRQPFDERGRR